MTGFPSRLIALAAVFAAVFVFVGPAAAGPAERQADITLRPDAAIAKPADRDTTAAPRGKFLWPAERNAMMPSGGNQDYVVGEDLC